MKVKLVNYTSDAKNLLLFTKNTRLLNEESAYDAITKWPEQKKQGELDYMLRTVNMKGFGYHATNAILENPEAKQVYDETMQSIHAGYHELLKMGINAEDARGVLPTNIHTNIVAKFSLRTLHEMAKSRLSPRAQGEYQEVFKLIVKEVVAVHSWAEPFLTPTEWSAPSMSKALNSKKGS